ncbi:hypothetical protein BH10ACI4_BH10ACI4_31760 [soil metagenome]
MNFFMQFRRNSPTLAFLRGDQVTGKLLLRDLHFL